MINIFKVISTEIIAKGRRAIKGLRLGKQDVQTPVQSAPFGSDANPPPNLRAVYVRTGVKGDTIVVGFINLDQLAEVGENRQFSTDPNGNLIFEARMRNDGIYEIGGSVDNLIRFAKLDLEMQALAGSLNTELTKISVAIAGLGGAYTVSPITINISAAKIAELKTS